MRKSACWFLLMVIGLSLLYSIIPTLSVQWSTTMQFSVTPDIVYLNWTNNYNSSFNITANNTYQGGSFNVTINNGTFGNGVYSLFFNYTTNNYDCGTYAYHCVKLLLHNTSGNVKVQSINLTNTSVPNNETFYLVNTSANLPGGRYVGTIQIYNTSLSTEQANITAILDIPLDVSNNTGIGTFGSTTSMYNFPANNSLYHSIYFNTSSMVNATDIKINISGWSSSQNVDLFLFNGSNLVGKSINKYSNNESLIYSFLPPSPAMWEIRIYGNDTNSISYFGSIYYSTLNVSNRSIDHGIKNASTLSTPAYSDSTNIVLANVGVLNISNIMETKELYYVTRFYGNGTRNFTFLVPDSSIAQKIKVSLNWTTPTNSSYMFNVYKPDKTFAINSLNKFLYANVTSTEAEEYNETTDISSGYWTVEVKNSTVNSAIENSYNLSIYISVNASAWITTNYTNSSSGVTLNASTFGLASSTTLVNVSLTVPNSTMNGIYEGYLKYLDVNGVGVKIPVRVNISAPVLIVNGTWNTATASVTENINTSLSTTPIKTFNITINNTGSVDITSITTTNSTSLNLTSSNNYYINFTYQAPTRIPAGGSLPLNITMTPNTSITLGRAGEYRGWIILYTNSSEYSSYPYSNFTLNLLFNLTNLLDVRVVGVNPYDGSTTNWIQSTSSPKNVTIEYLNVYYINGTKFTGTSLFNYTNISYVYLSQPDAQYQSSNLNFNEVGDSLHAWSPGFDTGSGNYRFNITLPRNLTGGNYKVNVHLRDSTGLLEGESSNTTLFVNKTGLYMKPANYSSFTPSFSLNNYSTGVFYVNVSNFGLLNASSATITFSESCALSATAGSGNLTGGCLGSGSGSTFTISPYANNGSCLVWWTITTTTTETCNYGYIIGGPADQWFNPNGINASITVTAGGSSSSSPSSSSSNLPNTTTAPAFTANLAFIKADSMVVVQQNSSNSTEVGVSNTGNTNQNITFAIESINSSWYSLNATNAYLVVGKAAGFKVNFNVGNVEVKDYSGVFKAFSTNKTITSNFVLRVTPTPTTKTQINETLETYKLNMTKLEQQLDQLKKQGYNTTDVQKKFDELKLKVEQAENYIKGGDYNNAYYLFDDIKRLLSEVKDDLTKAKKTGFLGFISLPQGITLYILIGVGIAVGGFLAYLFWPTRGLAKPAYGAKTEEVKKPKPAGPSKLEQLKGLKEKLSNLFKREKNKPKYLFNQSS